jgi:hypothetical protein
MKKSVQLALIQPPSEEASPALKSWALVELFGHQRVVGWMTVDPPEFPGMIRIDVPDLLKDGKMERRGHTRYIGRASVYGVTPIDEDTVRKMLPSVSGAPCDARPYTLRDEY